MLTKPKPPVNPARHMSERAVTLPDMFNKRVEATPEATAFLSKKHGEWKPTTWRQFHAQAGALASYLIAAGIKPGDKICILGSTRVEWAVCDLGGQLAGVVTIGAYPTSSPQQIAYILDHSDSRIAIVEGHEELEKLRSVRADTPRLEKIIVWNDADIPTGGLDGFLVPLSEVLRTAVNTNAIAERVNNIKAEDSAILVYTSGTTGPPKGAIISQGNIIAFLRGARNLIEFSADDISLNFLPMAHVAERIAGFYTRISAGITAAYASSIPAVLDEVKEVRPTVFGSVPRIFEKAYARMMGEVAKAPPAKKAVFKFAEGIGREVVQHWQAGRRIPLLLRLKYKLVDKLVFSKIREVFGGRVRHFVTGAAPISNEILEFFWAAGFPIYEVYGMTEATVMTHANLPGKVRLGSVGRALPMIEEKLADDGEILLRGPTVFQGYYKNDAATAEAIDADGWLHTGDIGRREKDGYLKIIDRKKHIIITAGGKNITPANIEQEIKGQDPLISQVHVHGDRRSYLTALLTIHANEAIEWARERKLLKDPQRADAILKELMSNPLARPDGLAEIMRTVADQADIQKRLVAAVKRANDSLSRVESIKRIYVLDRDFSLEEDEVTPTMKVKRKEVEKKFATTFDSLYADASFGIVVDAAAESLSQ